LFAREAAVGAETNDPIASVARRAPAPWAVYPRTLCRNSGKENRMPNSPRLTIRAAAEPRPKVAMRKRVKSISADLPARVRRVSTRNRTRRQTRPRTRAMATGDTAPAA
jgi:hypothetical protein